MAKSKTVYTCTECGGTTLKWQGQCPHCSEWNTLVETAAESSSKAAGGHRFASLSGTAEVIELSAVEAKDFPRLPTLIAEFDRVLGGGLVEGGVVLIGGDPGIGKSTLLLQAVDALQRAGRNAIYVTGEESGAQVALRSRRGASRAAPPAAPIPRRSRTAPAPAPRGAPPPAAAASTCRCPDRRR